jgi:flagellar biosynthesis protein FlhB
VAEDSGQEKTESATPKRREEARKKGTVARSRELPSVLVLLSSLGIFCLYGVAMVESLSEVMQRVFEECGTFQLQDASAYTFLLQVMQYLGIMVAPFFLANLVCGLMGNILQVGFFVSSESMTPQWSRLDPLSGMRKFVSLTSFVELVKAILKITVLAVIAWAMLHRELAALPSLMEMEVGGALAFFARVSYRIMLYSGLALFLMALLDYGFQRWQYEKNLRMTKQEVKDEMRQREGDPLIKSRIRRIQIGLARRRMMEAVPQADVIITNPTRLAIALKYEAQNMVAPQVVAKGAGDVAERIRSIAKEHGIPIVEHKPLAQALYKAVDIGAVIPAALYRAVAEILAYVYRLRGTRH